MATSDRLGPPNTHDPSTNESLTLEAEAQQVLDELLLENLIPFQLSIGKLTREIGAYTIHFHDSRIHNAQVPLTKGTSFRDMVRVSVLARVAKMSGPLSR
jgi:hypothetical protein